MIYTFLAKKPSLMPASTWGWSTDSVIHPIAPFWQLSRAGLAPDKDVPVAAYLPVYHVHFHPFPLSFEDCLIAWIVTLGIGILYIWRMILSVMIICLWWLFVSLGFKALYHHSVAHVRSAFFLFSLLSANLACSKISTAWFKSLKGKSQKKPSYYQKMWELPVEVRNKHNSLENIMSTAGKWDATTQKKYFYIKHHQIRYQ